MTKQTTVVLIGSLRVKVLITTATDDIFFFFLFPRKEVRISSTYYISPQDSDYLNQNVTDGQRDFRTDSDSM